MDENTSYKRRSKLERFAFQTRDAHIDKACKTKDFVDVETFPKVHFAFGKQVKQIEICSENEFLR